MAIAYGISEFLREHRVPFEVFWHRHADTALRMALEAGVAAGRMVKAVILDAEGQLYMVLLPADRLLDIHAIEDYVGAKVRLADPMEFEWLFDDCKPGAVPALGPAYGVTTLLDEQLARADDVYFDAGDQEELIHVHGARFRQLLGQAEVGRFAREHQGDI